MTPAQLAKVSKAARDLGYTNQEIDACNGDQAALLALLASDVSELTVQAGAIVYGPRKPNPRKLKDVEDDIAKQRAPAVLAAVKKVK